MKALAVIAVALATVMGLASSGTATTISDPEVAYQTGTGVNPALLSGTIDWTLSMGNTRLTVVIHNTSVDAAGDGVGVLLCGFALDIPGGLSGNTVTPVSDTIPVGNASWNALATSLASEWGFSVPSTSTGMTSPGASHQYSIGVGTVSSMAQTGLFPGGDIGGSPNLDGPDFGIQSPFETSVPAQRYLMGGTATFVFDFASAIDGPTAGLIAFASANTHDDVPDGGSTVLLLGMSLAALGVMARRARRLC